MTDRSPPVPIDADIEGRVDDYSAGVLSGWATIVDLNRPCPLEIVGPDGFYEIKNADLYRADLDRAGKRNGLCAFSVITGLPERYVISDFAVVPAGLPHRLRSSGDNSIEPVRGWLDVAQDPLAQHLVVHRCHYALAGTAAPLSLLTSARPELPMSATSMCTAMARVVEHTKGSFQVARQDDATATIRNVYRGMLRRDAYPSEVERHRRGWLSGSGLSDLVEELAGLPEFLQGRGLTQGKHRARSGEEDGFAPELHRVSDSIEKALLTLAVAASRDKPAVRTPSRAAEPVVPAIEATSRTKAAGTKRPVMVRGHLSPDRTLPRSGTVPMAASDDRRRRPT